MNIESFVIETTKAVICRVFSKIFQTDDPECYLPWFVKCDKVEVNHDVCKLVLHFALLNVQLNDVTIEVVFNREVSEYKIEFLYPKSKKMAIATVVGEKIDIYFYQTIVQINLFDPS